LTSPLINGGLANPHRLCGLTDGIIFIDNKFCNLLSEFRFEMWLSRVATLVKGDDDITSNSVAKFSMPLHRIVSVFKSDRL
jgi:hypothetical protein